MSLQQREKGANSAKIFACSREKKMTTKKWTMEATDMLLDLWSEETIQFALTNSKTSKETREVYNTLQVSKHMLKLDSVQHISLPFKIIVDECQTARDKLNCNIFSRSLRPFFHCIFLSCIDMHGTFLIKYNAKYKCCASLL